MSHSNLRRAGRARHTSCLHRSPSLYSRSFCPPDTQGSPQCPVSASRKTSRFEVAIRRFKRTIEKTGVLTELRSREFYEKPTAERKRKLAAAVKRNHKRLRSQMLPPKLY